MNFKQKQKQKEIDQKLTKKLLPRKNIQSQINSRFTPASDSKYGKLVLIPSFSTEKLQPFGKRPYQIIVKSTDVRYNFLTKT